MTNYRRNHITGATYFFTVNLAERHNPVKHGLVAAVRDWPYSSFHRYVQQGLLHDDWAGGALAVEEGDFGEIG